MGIALFSVWQPSAIVFAFFPFSFLLPQANMCTLWKIFGTWEAQRLVNLLASKAIEMTIEVQHFPIPNRKKPEDFQSFAVEKRCHEGLKRHVYLSFCCPKVAIGTAGQERDDGAKISSSIPILYPKAFCHKVKLFGQCKKCTNLFSSQNWQVFFAFFGAENSRQEILRIFC